MAFSETIANQSYPRGQSIAPLTLPVVTAEIPPINIPFLRYQIFHLDFSMIHQTLRFMELHIFKSTSIL